MPVEEQHEGGEQATRATKVEATILMKRTYKRSERRGRNGDEDHAHGVNVTIEGECNGGGKSYKSCHQQGDNHGEGEKIRKRRLISTTEDADAGYVPGEGEGDEGEYYKIDPLHDDDDAHDDYAEEYQEGRMMMTSRMRRVMNSLVIC